MDFPDAEVETGILVQVIYRRNALKQNFLGNKGNRKQEAKTTTKKPSTEEEDGLISSLSLIAQGALEHKLHQRSCSIQRQEDWAFIPLRVHHWPQAIPPEKHRKCPRGRFWCEPLEMSG